MSRRCKRMNVPSEIDLSSNKWPWHKTWKSKGQIELFHSKQKRKLKKKSDSSVNKPTDISPWKPFWCKSCSTKPETIPLKPQQDCLSKPSELQRRTLYKTLILISDMNGRPVFYISAEDWEYNISDTALLANSLKTSCAEWAWSWKRVQQTKN